MALSPDYGETPLDGDEFDALLPSVREALGESVSKAQVYDLEQAVQDEIAAELLTATIAGDVSIDTLLADYFVRDLHRRLYAEIWTWGGLLRQRELNIGIAPENIAVELRTSLETLLFRWRETDDFSPQQFGIAVHAETVRIHPFVDGNGRATRLLADLAFIAAQDANDPELYDWSLDKRSYISLLRQYDVDRDPLPLAAFVEVRPITT